MTAGPKPSINIFLSYAQKDLAGTPFEHIQPLPRTGQAISSWSDRRRAWKFVDQEIRAVINANLFHP